MTSTKKYCDRCGKEMRKDAFPVSIINSRKVIKTFGYGEYSFCKQRLELCRECSSALDKFLSEAPS